MDNLKIPCSNIDKYGYHQHSCYLCGGSGYTVISASFTTEPITKIVTISRDSCGNPEYKIIKDGFGRIIGTENIQKDWNKEK